MSIELSIIAPHVPSICHEDQAPDFQKGIVEGLKEVAKEIAQIGPDAIVLVSCHWPTTFAHYVDCYPVHKGLLTAQEAPDLIKDVPYYYPGDAELAAQLVQAGKDAELSVEGVYDEHFVWDYGTVVPLRYLVPNEDIPVINLSVTLAANLEETYRWGQVIAKVLRESDKKVVFVASGALAHNLVRGRHHMPTLAEHAMDKQFVEFVMNKEYQAAYAMLPQFSSMAKVESGGRHLAMLFGIIDEDSTPVYYADAQSSGSWNPLITFRKTRVSSKEVKSKEEYVK
ncbi:DODA-type extradiol aromatic ring-opening family dioxygenase [Niallia endozanthoxylica]|uniref:Extradiol ring-cleavage dioxygenase n=1 Tax=Niallia endozanthoxylica TaxID=2036016 RepID=A0A5J5I445_9BACI|nr:extradiol ring-cleavage dioxygenase [Niallia endozanthoxylica]KAA9028424.1 extradiol ring-cleavage dioxygenase [Niallia endozanthoxylica]